MQLKYFCFLYILFLRAILSYFTQTPEHHLKEEYYAYRDDIFDSDNRSI